jgi:ABC-2 type transport system permease protein
MSWHYAAQRLKVEVAYRADFWVSLWTTLGYTCLQLFFLWALFSRVNAIGGWSFEQVVLIYGFSQLSMGYFAVFGQELTQRLADFYILEANLDRPLLRPLPPLLQLIMENLALRDAQVCVKGTAIVWWALAHISPPVAMTPGVFLLAQWYGLCGGMVFTGVFLAISSLNFWINDRTGLVNPFFSVAEAARYPLTIYNERVRFVFTTALPFAFCAFIPAAALTEDRAWGRLAAISPLAGLLALLAATLVFQRGLRRYESAGS